MNKREEAEAEPIEGSQEIGDKQGINEPIEILPEEEDESPVKGNGRRKKIIFGGATALLIAIIAGGAYWLYSRQFESTDDAFIDGDIVQISPRVSAYVTKIHVVNNQLVHKGDLLLELNTSDLEVKLERAKADLETARSHRGQAVANADLTKKVAGAAQTQARSNVETTKSNVDQTRYSADAKQAQITQARAAARTAAASLQQTQAQQPQAESNLKLAQTEYDRRKTLFDKGDISHQALDQALNNLQTAQAQLNGAQKQVLAAESRVGEANAAVAAAEQNYRQSVAQVATTQSQVGESQARLEDANAAPERVEVSQSEISTADAGILAAEAAVHQAELELSYTKIYSPEDGYVTKKSVEIGQLVQVGAPLMAISHSDDVWVVANFKETQLENMQIGQAVDIEVDAFPSETFHGKVESFQAGTGSRFSLLPAENATGNYVKVVQRLPVKIVFEESPETIKRLVPGMSVEPSVKVR
ncbi:MAG TPA: HlyD family secretion protein [Pyrinomonadaceae bacterium]|nr:HlyD family secretion protein [Pyrinomonadaceae bacterium]